MRKFEQIGAIKANVIDAVSIDRLTEQVSNIKAQVNGIRTKVEDFVSKDEAFWMGLCFFLLGLVIGMIISPKGNTNIGSNNQVHNTEGFEDDECDSEKCCSDDGCCAE